jgi:ABC-2 type transport system permease protein
MLEIKTFLAYIRTSIKSSISLRESFLLQSLFMLISNLVFFSFWWIYFNNFNSIKGWTLSDIACLYGIVNGAYGLFSVFFGGSRFIARMIFEGDLDALIVKPKNLLMQVMGSRSVSSGWGDLVSSVVFLIISGHLTFFTIPLVLLFILTACMIITSFSIIMGSLAFWITDSHSLSKQIFEFLLTFSNYPKSIYTGVINFFLLSVIPSGFIGFMPVEVIKNFSIDILMYILFFSFFYSYLAKQVFYTGLRFYSSGNKPGFKV